MRLEKALSLTDLTIFGIASILGSGGFNLIGNAVASGGSWWIVSCGIATILLLGASYTYSRAVVLTPNGNTMESDIVGLILGNWAEVITTAGIGLFNIVNISVILVFCSHILFPKGKWIGQITFAIAILAGMAVLGLQGIDMNRDVINFVSIALLIILASISILGYIGPFFHSESLDQSISSAPNFRVSLFTFFFILAGFDVLAKFMEEAKDPSDIPKSFFTSITLSSILTIGISMALFFWIPNLTNNENAIEQLVGNLLGKNVEVGFKYVIVSFMIMSAFIVFLSMTRYMYGLGKKYNEPFLSNLNEKKAPYIAIGVLFALSALGILNNHTDTLVMISDLGIIVSILLVSASVTIADWKGGDFISTILSGLTTAGFGGFLSLYVVG
jgi:amino acid transporter